jgi:hypothetical protein
VTAPFWAGASDEVGAERRRISRLAIITVKITRI